MQRTWVQRLKGSLAAAVLVLAVPVVFADDWPQWLGPRRDGVWRETGILERFPKGGPKVRWRTPIGIGYAGPAVSGGKVYVTDRILAQGAVNPKSGFSRNVVDGKERVLCLDEATGNVLWKHEYPVTYEIAYPGGPRVTPVIDSGKVYTLGAMGDLLCLDAANGKVLWSKNFPRDYNATPPVWGFAAHPLIDGDQLICVVGGEGSVAVAFDKNSGKELWKNLSAAEPGYCPPMIFDAAGKRQLIIWHPEAVNSLDPRTGKLNWSQKFAVKAGLAVPTPRVADDRLFITSFYNGSMLLKLDGSVVWRSKGKNEKQTADLNAIMVTPFIHDGYVYGVCSYGQLRCLKLETGERIWESLQATGGKEARWGNAFLIPNADRYFIFNEHGDLIIARLTPKGYEEIDRARVLKPTNTMAGRPVVWMHPAFANKNMYARNDEEIICVSLAAE